MSTSIAGTIVHVVETRFGYFAYVHGQDGEGDGEGHAEDESAHVDLDDVSCRAYQDPANDKGKRAH